MKTLLYSLLFIIFTDLAIGQNAEFEYFKSIQSVYKPIQKDSWDYTSAVAKGRNARKLENKRQDLINTINAAIKTVRSVRPRDADFGLRDSALAYLKMSLYVYKNEYQKVIDMEAIAEESYDAMEAYILTRERANDMVSKKFDELDVVVNEYAIENNITLLQDDSKLAEKLRKAGEAFDYYNEVYLIFYKCNFYESKLIQEISAADINGATQSRSALLQYIKDGEEKLEKILDYNGDKSLRVACKVILNFYKQEAEDDLPTLIDFHVQKKDYDQTVLEFNALSKKERTKEAVDNYNATINNFNALVAGFNEINNRLNKERTTQLNNYQKSVDAFLGKHAI